MCTSQSSLGSQNQYDIHMRGDSLRKLAHDITAAEKSYVSSSVGSLADGDARILVAGPQSIRTKKVIEKTLRFRLYTQGPRKGAVGISCNPNASKSAVLMSKADMSLSQL